MDHGVRDSTCRENKNQVPVAQWIARWTSNPEVAGSNPAGDDAFVSPDVCP